MRHVCVLKKYQIYAKGGNRPDALRDLGQTVPGFSKGLEAKFSPKDDEMRKTCVLRRWHPAAQALGSTNLLDHTYSAVL